MRLWSIHPKFLHYRFLNGLWRNGLTAKKELIAKDGNIGEVPDLERFKQVKKPLPVLNHYLYCVWKEAKSRGYKYDISKIDVVKEPPWRMTVTKNQLRHEWSILLKACKEKYPDHYKLIKKQRLIPHPMFRAVKGPIESWDKNIIKGEK